MGVQDQNQIVVRNMREVKIYNVIDNSGLPSVEMASCPENGDPLELNKEMYYVCERNCSQRGEVISIGVIPLVIRNPRLVSNIESYINCLSVAHRRVLFRKQNKLCDFEECDEMIIS